ncbi:CHC2-type zinc finger protein [Roseateles saccharophilus]|uniref:CHC2-type zinc finger protein n=1 Tax=Roseateles saccharophilus TaxID=304 RepID=A0A4R3UBT4_ROSSA|nr:CHC2-type zinc finger protein [Roseateles saccharophilus]
MARFPEIEIEVVGMIEASGIELKKGGKDLLGHCPVREDDTASLVVTSAKNVCPFFGCGVGGAPVDWAMRHKGLCFLHAVELPNIAPCLGSRQRQRRGQAHHRAQAAGAVTLDDPESPLWHRNSWRPLAPRAAAPDAGLEQQRASQRRTDAGPPESGPGAACAGAGLAGTRRPGPGGRRARAPAWPRLIQRIGASSRSAFTAPPPMAAPKRLARRSATLSRGV